MTPIRELDGITLLCIVGMPPLSPGISSRILFWLTAGVATEKVRMAATLATIGGKICERLIRSIALLRLLLLHMRKKRKNP
jgi:hypothetical protein